MRWSRYSYGASGREGAGVGGDDEGYDDEEYKAFVVARYRTLVRSAVLLGCSKPDAEDAAQDALIRCYRSRGRLSAARDPDAYVYRVL